MVSDFLQTTLVLMDLRAGLRDKKYTAIAHGQTMHIEAIDQHIELLNKEIDRLQKLDWNALNSRMSDLPVQFERAQERVSQATEEFNELLKKEQRIIDMLHIVDDILTLLLPFR